MASDVRNEFADKIADRCGGQGDRDAIGAGSPASFAVGHVAHVDCLVGDVAHNGGVVQHPFAGIAVRPEGLIDAVGDAGRERGVGQAVVVRILMVDGRNEEGFNEGVGHVLGEGDAADLGESVATGAVGGVRVGGDGVGRCADDGEKVEGIDDAAHGEVAQFARGVDVNRVLLQVLVKGAGGLDAATAAWSGLTAGFGDALLGLGQVAGLEAKNIDAARNAPARAHT